MNKTLYIGNLPNEITEQDLQANFAEAGQVVSVNIIKDKYTGLSRGFGFVEMGNAEEAQKAIRKFNGGELSGKVITVNEARPKNDSGGGPGGDRSRGSGFGGGRGGGRRF